MNLVGEIQSLRSGFYSNKFSDRIVKKVKALSREKDAVWYLGQYYPMYQPGEQIHLQDWFYKIYHLGTNALNFLSARKIQAFPEHTPYGYSKYFENGDTLIYYPGPDVSSKFLPAPESLPSIFAGRVESSIFVFKNQSEKVKSFMTRDGLFQIQLTSIDNSHMVIEVNMKDNQDSARVLWFKLDHRIIKSDVMERNFFYFKNNEEMVLPAGRHYFERIQEITLLRHEAEEFR